jgi:hypothetical protein
LSFDYRELITAGSKIERSCGTHVSFVAPDGHTFERLQLAEEVLDEVAPL